MYCRRCTRKRKVGGRDFVPSKKQLEKGIEYIKNSPEVREGVITTYLEPEHYTGGNCDLHCDRSEHQHVLKIKDEEEKTTGVVKLLADFDDIITLTPNEEDSDDNRQN